MNVTQEETQFAYRVGEDVVVRLSGVEVFDVDSGGKVHDACVPPWTIASVAGRVVRRGIPHYALRFSHHGTACLCVADERAIEGIA
jgi:hypothetical protein